MYDQNYKEIRLENLEACALRYAGENATTEIERFVLAVVELAETDNGLDLERLYAELTSHLPTTGVGQTPLIDPVQTAEGRLRKHAAEIAWKAAYEIGYRRGVQDHALLMLKSRRGRDSVDQA